MALLPQPRGLRDTEAASAPQPPEGAREDPERLGSVLGQLPHGEERGRVRTGPGCTLPPPAARQPRTHPCGGKWQRKVLPRVAEAQC